MWKILGICSLLMTVGVSCWTGDVRADDDWKDVHEKQYERQKEYLDRLEDEREDALERWREAEEERLERAEEHALRYSQGRSREAIKEHFDDLEDALEDAGEREEEALEAWEKVERRRLHQQYKSSHWPRTFSRPFPSYAPELVYPRSQSYVLPNRAPRHRYAAPPQGPVLWDPRQIQPLPQHDSWRHPR